jgi:phospholipase C
MHLSRRKLLAGAAAVGGATAAMALPPNLAKAMADTPPQSFSPKEVKHIVFLMQENRSFDQYFGTFPGVRGFGDPTAIKLSTGKRVFFQPDPANPDGYLLPFHLDTRAAGGQAAPDTDHSWGGQHSAWNGGAMDNWVPAIGGQTMGYYQSQDLPFHRALAENFTILDNYHCSVLGPTTPNRLMHMTGSLDPNGVAGGPILETGDFTGSWPTYAESLTNAGVTWRVYDEDITIAGFAVGIVLLGFVNFQKSTTTPGSVLFDSAIDPKLHAAGRFEFDCQTGNLPAVSWVHAPGVSQEHPPNWPAQGSAWIAAKLDALAANRELWESTVVIINYDENGGLFDHVVPPTPPPGTPDEFVTKTSPPGTPGGGLPVGLGFRVPCIIVSPWTQGGWVNSDINDHTSCLKFAEVVTGVPCTQISAWRRQTVGDLTGAFAGPRYDPTPPVIPDTNGELQLAKFTSTLPLPPIPGAAQTFPVQSPGHRKHTR